MNNKLIIATTSFFILVSFFFLALIERNQADINTKNVWMIYFENPKDKSLNFTIENHSSNNNFHWQALSDKIITNQGDANIKVGQTKNIPVSITDSSGKKITIVVTTGNEKKEIYKIISND